MKMLSIARRELDRALVSIRTVASRHPLSPWEEQQVEEKRTRWHTIISLPVVRIDKISSCNRVEDNR